MKNLLRLAQRTFASAIMVAAVSVPATGAFAQSIAPGITPNGPLPRQLVVNGGFEDLATSLNTPDHGWQRTNIAVAGAVPLPNIPFVSVLGYAGGTSPMDRRVGPFCGNNVLATGNTWNGPGAGFAYQQVFIPANAPQPTLNFHLLVDSTVPTSEWNGAWYVPILYSNPDFLKVYVVRGTGDSSLNADYAKDPTKVTPLATYTQYTANPGLDSLSPTGWFGKTGWVRKGDFDLSAFRGESIQIIFGKMTASPPSETTNFYVDNVELWTAPPTPIQLLNQPC